MARKFEMLHTEQVKYPYYFNNKTGAGQLYLETYNAI